MATSIPTIALAQGGFSGPGRYEISNIKSGRTIGIDRNDQTGVMQLSGAGEFQVWDIQPADSGYYYFRNAGNGKALDILENRNSALVVVTRFNGGAGQQWRIDTGKDGNALITSRYGRTLDIPDGSDRDGVRIQVYDRNGDSNQRFLFRALRGGGPGELGPRRDWDRDRDRDRGPAPLVLTCSSDDGRRHLCRADTSGKVRLTRQISGSPCRLDETWGYDRNGIWVDRGCRAEFEVIAAPPERRYDDRR